MKEEPEPEEMKVEEKHEKVKEEPTEYRSFDEERAASRIA